MTPFQRQVIAKAREKEAEQRQQQQQQARAGPGSGPNRPRNARSSGPSGGQSSGLGQEETVRYINREENPDHSVHD